MSSETLSKAVSKVLIRPLSTKPRIWLIVSSQNAPYLYSGGRRRSILCTPTHAILVPCTMADLVLYMRYRQCWTYDRTTYIAYGRLRMHMIIIYAYAHFRAYDIRSTKEREKKKQQLNNSKDLCRFILSIGGCSFLFCLFLFNYFLCFYFCVCLVCSVVHLLFRMLFVAFAFFISSKYLWFAIKREFLR